MMGSAEEKGIIQQTVRDMFEYIFAHQERAFGLEASFLEIYNETIIDLLNPDNAKLGIGVDQATGEVCLVIPVYQLLLNESHSSLSLSLPLSSPTPHPRKPYVKGLTGVEITSQDTLFQLLEQGNENRFAIAPSHPPAHPTSPPLTPTITKPAKLRAPR